MNQVFFFYNNKRYPFNFDIFKNNSGYFSRIFGQNYDIEDNFTINLLSEFDGCKELSDESINSFINYCQNQMINLTNNNVIGVYFLSIKYEVPSLINKTSKFINKHYKEIVDQFLSTNINERESDEMFHIYEKIISEHIPLYLNDDRLLFFSINKLYRILYEYSKQEITDQKLKEKIECQLVEFLIKYIQKNGSEASFLFSIIKIGYKGSLLLNEKLSQCPNLIDFEHVKWAIFQSLNYMNIKQKKQMKKERQKIRLNLINTVNELFQKEQFIQDNNDNENNKSIALMKYGFLYSIGSIFNDDVKERDPKKLSKFDLLDFLLKENFLSTKSSILIENRKYIDIISLISNILVNQQKESIINLFKFIAKDSSAIDFVDKVFPYLIFKNLKPFKLLLIWIPCIKYMIQSKIKFSLEIEKNKFEFNQSSSELKIKINLKFNEKDDLSLSQGSEILYDKCKKSLNLININCTVIYYLIEELSIKKMATEEKMNEEEILNIYYSNAEEKYLIYDDQILCSNHVLSVKDLFIIDKSCPIICLMWNLIFSLTENEIIHIANIINPIESKILNSIQRMFDSISLENIQEIFYWNKWACGFDSFIPTITNCMIKSIDKTYEYPYAEIDSLLLNIKNAIDYLNKVICAYWSSKDLIKLCKVKYDYLNELKIQKNKLNIKFDIMIQHIASTEINKEYFEMKNNITKLINKNKTNLTDENYIKIKKVLDQFILEATSKNENKKNSDIINWPPQNEPQNDNETKNIKILKWLILYSEIKRLLSEIKDNKKIFYNLLILKNHPELSLSWKYLLKIIIFQSAENEYKSLFNSLDANLIVELFNIDNTLITYPNHLYDVINDYSKRKPCEEIEIQWIYKMIKKFSSDFLITIPQFYPNSIISLIVNKRDDKKYQYGPLLCFIDDLDQQILEEQFRLMNKNFHKFRHAAKSIAQVMYNSIYDKNKIAPQKFKKLKEFFENNLNIGNNYKSKISSQMKNLFLIAESLDKWTKPKLIYDDFIYESAQKHFTKYPSLLFWVCKNKKCAMQLKNLNENIRFNSEEIPLWMIYFRFLSSEQILCFEPASENKLYDIINTAIRNTVIHYKNASDEPKSNMSFEWINLLVSKPPHKIANKNIKMIHDFLVNFIDENDINDDGLIYKCIYGTISNLTELILSNKKNKFLDKHVSSNSLIQFLCYPSQYFSFKLYDGESSGISSCQNILDLSKTSAPLSSYSFSELTNLDYLSQPILFVSSTSKITCSMNELKINIGPIFPSICISPITINILNFISGKASASIENLEDPQNYQLISIDEKVEKSKILHIFIYPHKIKSKSKDSILLKGNINIKVKNYEDFRLPFLINLLLLPIKVEISCIQYSLFKHSNSIYQINCFEVKPNEQIDFEVININDHDLFILRADLESLDNNESDKPIITLDKKPKLVSLKIPQVDKSTKCKFNLIIKFSKYIETKIICDFVIQPYTVAFEVYDYCTEEFTSDACRIFLSKSNPKQTFYFRINTLSQSNQKCRISYKLPNPIKIDQTDLNSFNEFYVNELFSFNLVINNLSSQPDFNDNNDYGIALEIEKKIKKTIKFEFIHTNNEQLDHINKNSEQNNIYLSKYPCYLYQNDLNKWQRIYNNSDIPDYKDKSVNPYIITSPFRFYSNANEFIQINYNLDSSNIVNVTNQSNFHIKYIQISPNNTINNEIIKISSTIKSKTTVKTGKFMGLMNNKTTINYYSIIGFVEEKPEFWFPLIDQYPNIQGKQLLSYENQNYRIASAFISDINKIQNQNNTFRNSALLFNLLNNEKIFHNINSIIEQFPVCFRNRFSNLLRDINKYLILPKIEKNIHEIILYNLLISFLQIFSERIEEIKYLQCNLIMPLSSDKIKLQIKKSHDSLMFYNSILAKSKKINDSQFLIAKERDRINSKLCW